MKRWLIVVIGLSIVPPCLSWSQERISDQVSVTVSNGRVLGIHRGEGIARVPLAAGEEVVMTQAKGINGVIVPDFIETARILRNASTVGYNSG